MSDKTDKAANSAAPIIANAGAVADETARAAPRFEVELLKPHTHERRDLQPGAKIKVTAEQRTWLKSLGVIAGDTQEK